MSEDFTYRFFNDLDINLVYEHIYKFLSDNNINKEIEKKIIKIEKKLHKKINFIDFQRLINERENYIKSIKINSEKAEKFKNEIINIVKEYNKLDKFTKQATLGESNIVINKDYNERLKLAIKFSYVAKKYVNFNLIIKNINENKCPSCKQPLKIIYVDNFSICSNCGEETNYIEEDKVIISPDIFIKKKYNDIDNFERGMDDFEGKLSIPLPEDIIDRLIIYFSKKINMPSRKEILESSLDERGLKRMTSRKMLRDALKDLKLTSFYKCINHIGNILWGWKLPDLSSYKNRLINDYKATQLIYEEIKGDKKSSINSQFRLYWHLTDAGYPCTVEDFDLANTPEILTELEMLKTKINKIRIQRNIENYNTKNKN